MEKRDIPAERAVLGCLILQGIRGETGSAAIDDLKPQHFSSTAYRNIYKAITELLQEDLPPSAPLIMSKLRERGQLTDKDVPDFCRLSDGLEGDKNLAVYVSRLMECANRRIVHSKSKALADASGDGFSNAELTKLTHDIDYLLTNERGTGPPLVNLGKAFEAPVEPPWVVKNILIHKELTYLASESGVGKSWIAMALALDLVLGRPFLGRFDIVGKHRVMFVDEENPGPQILRRFGRLMRAYGLTKAEAAKLPIFYMFQGGFNLDDPRKRALLHRQIKALRPTVVIMDSLVRFHQRNENDNSEMARFFAEALKPIANMVDNVVVLHHLAKPGADRPSDIAHRIRGASDIRAAADMIWGLELGQDGRRYLVHVKTRSHAEYLPAEPFEIVDIDRSGTVVRLLEDVAGPGKAILGILRNAGSDGSLRGDLLEQIQLSLNIQTRTAEGHLKRLVTSGSVVSQMEGRVARYWLKECRLGPRNID